MTQEPRLYRLHFAPLPPNYPDYPYQGEELGSLLNFQIIVIPYKYYVEKGGRERKIFVLRQVRPSIESLNQSDVFVLDGGTDGWIFQWNGAF